MSGEAGQGGQRWAQRQEAWDSIPAVSQTRFGQVQFLNLEGEPRMFLGFKTLTLGRKPAARPEPGALCPLHPAPGPRAASLGGSQWAGGPLGTGQGRGVAPRSELPLQTC